MFRLRTERKRIKAIGRSDPPVLWRHSRHVCYGARCECSTDVLPQSTALWYLARYRNESRRMENIIGRYLSENDIHMESGCNHKASSCLFVHREKLNQTAIWLIINRLRHVFKEGQCLCVCVCVCVCVCELSNLAQRWFQGKAKNINKYRRGGWCIFTVK